MWWFKSKNKSRDMVREHLERGLEFAREGYFEEAENEFTASLEIAPDFKPTRLAFGAFLRDQERYEDALVHYHHLMKLDPEDAEPFFQMGETYLQAGRRDWAVAQYRQALLRKPDDPQAQARLNEAAAEQIDFSVGEGGSLREHQVLALAQFKQAKAQIKRQQSLGYRLRHLLTRRST
ncbi:tetratricopeptide repeat protein [bacterium]|nr:tetratricopeptide repeat protein [bacterium]